MTGRASLKPSAGPPSTTAATSHRVAASWRDVQWHAWLGWGAVAVSVMATVWLTVGVDPLTMATTVFRGTVGGVDPIAELIVRSIPLVVVGVAAALALRGGAFNVGGEGQMAAGAVTAALVTTAAPGWVPPPIVWLLALVTGAGGGAVWAAIPAWLWARREVSEILSTLLLNFVAVSLLGWLLTATPLQDPDPYVITAQGAPLAERLVLPVLIGGTRLHLGVVAAVLCVGLAIWWARTTAGVAIDVVGANPRLAAQGGLRPRTTRMWLLAASAAGAGIAGGVQLLGVSHRLSMGLTAGVGYTGLLVAVVGRGRPAATAAAAILFAFLATGGEALERAGVPRSLSLVITGLVVAAVALRQWRTE